MVHNGEQGSQCTYDTWTFPETSAWPHTAKVTSFSGSRLSVGTTHNLIPVDNLSLEDLTSPVGQATLGVNTASSPDACLNGESLNIFSFDGRYFLHNGQDGSQCTYATWEMAPPR